MAQNKSFLDQINRYQQEAKDRWGNTEAFRQFEKRAAQAAAGSFAGIGPEMSELFAEFGKVRSLSPEDAAVQELVGKLQRFISTHFYDCKKDILKGLGEMYVSDPRFTENIDRSGGKGTAEFVSRAIRVFCQR